MKKCNVIPVVTGILDETCVVCPTIHNSDAQLCAWAWGLESCIMAATLRLSSPGWRGSAARWTVPYNPPEKNLRQASSWSMAMIVCCVSRIWRRIRVPPISLQPGLQRKNCSKRWSAWWCACNNGWSQQKRQRTNHGILQHQFKTKMMSVMYFGQCHIH